jgi:hypothetical protein
VLDFIASHYLEVWNETVGRANSPSDEFAWFVQPGNVEN